ncbi:MAG TPA: NAD(P)-binding protein [Thermoplasmata archaeon]|nr:NAD(P)-binding protein [Thermoplasmata archaeon]
MKGNIEDNKRKIPGMLYILVSFIPWIVYWVLCGMGKPGGILIPFVISSLLIIPQIRRKGFNPMDLASFLYFTIALVGTFIFSLNIFVESNAILGYSVLFLMASLSLIIKQPFTLQCAKRDYPESYWRDKSFLAINNLITMVWAGVFLLNAIIFLLLSAPFNTIFTNILIAFGVVFSVIFPLKAPAYFVSRESKKHDWSAEANAQKPKKENEYDILIVGSGIGGLTCGSLLSKRGYKVLVLEQHYQVGGYCSSFQRKGFGFNTGVEDVSGLWTRGIVNHFLKELGLKKENLFVKNTTRYIFKGKEIEANNSVEFIKALS